MDANSPILLFDSGVGGLTVYDALRDVLPNAPVIYAADFAGIPYGQKSEAEVAARVAGLLGRMSERFRPRLVCIACNTASTIALGMVREVLEIPIVGTVPAIKPAAALTTTGTIGLIGTQATIRQAYVDRLEAEFAADKTLIRFAAPDLVDLAEAKLRGDTPNPGRIDETVALLKDNPAARDIDTIVLACTHFPFLAEELGAALGAHITFVDGAHGIARRIAHLIDGQPLEGAAANRFVVTGGIDRASGLEAALGKRNFASPEAF